jgi:plastocyanin
VLVVAVMASISLSPQSQSSSASSHAGAEIPSTSARGSYSSTENKSSATSHSTTSRSTTSGSWVPTYTTSSTNQTQGLRLELQIYTNSSGYVSIRIDEFNLLSSRNNVTAEGKWPNLEASNNAVTHTVTVGGNSNFGPSLLNPYNNCPLAAPDGLAILSGRYDLTNFTSGNLLRLYGGPNAIVSCVASIYPTTYYSFSPSSSNASVLDSRGGTPAFTGGQSLSFSSYGYWTGGPETFVPFAPNSTYTVLAADEWGRVALVNFKLNGSSSVANLSNSLCQPALDGNVFLRIVPLQGPPIQNMTITVGHVGSYVGNFNCGGGSYGVSGYSSSAGYVRISGIDGKPATGYYDVSFRQISGIAFGTLIYASNSHDNASVYATITVPSGNETSTTCYPNSPCAATTSTTSACSSSTSQSTSPSPNTTEISIGSNSSPGSSLFAPDNVTVVIGVNNTVRWTSSGLPPPHSVTWISGPPCGPTFDSGFIANGGSYAFTFETPGTYYYGSVNNPGLVASVTVKPSG